MEFMPSASYSFTLRVEFPHRVGSLGKILTAVGDAASHGPPNPGACGDEALG